MKKWSTKDVIILALIGFLFGGIFLAAGWVYAALEAALTPLGYEPFANSILFGLWVMAAPVAAVLVKKPGSATLGEVLGALAEMLYGSFFGAAVLVSGLVQGLGSEVGFLVTKYKRYDSTSLFLSAIGITVFSFVYEYFKLGYEAYSTGMIIALFAVRFISVVVFGVICVKLILNIVNKVQNSGNK